MNKIIVITGASSGFGRLTANALARSGHTVYASMRETTGRNAQQAADVRKFAEENRVDLRPIELDVLSQESSIVPSRRSSPNTEILTWSFITQVIWSLAQRRPSPRNNSLSCTTSTCSALSG